MELLAPAGNLEKLKMAVLYGADAVYCGSGFGLRAGAENFTPAEMAEGIAFAHAHHCKVYVTMNMIPHEDDLDRMPDSISSFERMGADALIVSDPGVFDLVRSLAPNMEIHISTQANNTNHASAAFWHRQGARRVVLARELTLEEIKRIRRQAPSQLKLEVFVHGAVCMAYSGRCLLSAYLTGRDANRGLCAQPCRWRYSLNEGNPLRFPEESRPGESRLLLSGENRPGESRLLLSEESRPGEMYPIEEEERGSFILSAKDLCMIRHIPALYEAGVDSFKIEGRMKSAYYVAVVTKAYRDAMDAFEIDKEAYRFDPDWQKEVESVSHREYHTGFYFGKDSSASFQTRISYVQEYEFVGLVTGYDPVRRLLSVEQRNRFQAGDILEAIEPVRGGKPVSITANQLFDSSMQPVAAAPHPQMTVLIPSEISLKPASILRKKVDHKIF
ncbi:MAG TPA: peptidase U32 [Clostridiales bacterium]|nr:peptidase U32 [Clostridiales bacterium]